MASASIIMPVMNTGLEGKSTCSFVLVIFSHFNDRSLVSVQNHYSTSKWYKKGYEALLSPDREIITTSQFKNKSKVCVYLNNSGGAPQSSNTHN